MKLQLSWYPTIVGYHDGRTVATNRGPRESCYLPLGKPLWVRNGAQWFATLVV